MMRLIDAYQLRQTICAACSERLLCSDRDNVCFEIACINNAPTVEAEPMRHGQWIELPNPCRTNYECSECGALGAVKTPYCAYCGAKMDMRVDGQE